MFSPIPRSRHYVPGAFFLRPVHSLTSFGSFIFLVFPRHPKSCPGGNFCHTENRSSPPRPRGLPSVCSRGPSPSPSGRSFLRHLMALGEACLFLLPLSKCSQMSVCFLLLCAFQKTGEDQILVNISVPLFLSLLLSKEVGGGEGMFASFRVGLKLAKPENSFISSPWGIGTVN